MIAAFRIDLEEERPELDVASFRGEALAAAQHELASIAQELSIPALGELVSFSREEREALDEDMHFGGAAVEGSVEHWFSAAHGLGVVRPLAAYLREHPDELAAPEAVLAELDALEGLLAELERAGVRFHLSVEY